MHSIAEAAPEALFNLAPIGAAPSLKALPSAWIDRLFQRLDQAYPGRWLNSIGDLQATKDTWATGLCDMSGDEIARGLSACLHNFPKWPPSLPEFRQCCRPPRDPEQAFRAAANILGRDPIDWKGDAVLFWTVQAVGAYDVRQRPYEGTLKARWADALRDAEHEHATNGLPMPPAPPAGLIEEKPTPADVAHARFGAIKQQLKGVAHA